MRSVYEKGGVGGKNKMPQNIGSFMGSKLDEKSIGAGSKPRLSPSGPEKIGISLLPAEGPL
jgi:hypothetical protein